ncbi:glycosyltransferase [Methylobacterium tarhaniae]|uniref:glycosyltransferase n=1 Tax=Methylobacterium tarhaniae TaxID=1187852 RepID=UPI000A97ADC0|nr:glycosyltransferase [Methylobacterium tarhaniae]
MNNLEIRQWVFSFDERSAEWFRDMIKVAVISAREKTKLEPICLFDGNGERPILSWLRSNGVKIIRTCVPFRQELFSAETTNANAGTPFTPEHAAGAYLRMYSPEHVDDEFFLYTDCDVMFTGDVENMNPKPPIVAACGETVAEGIVVKPGSTFNSGVMIINKTGFKAARDMIIDIARKHNFYHKKNFSYDQTIINMALEGKWDVLPATMNWRPFQGINKDARIVHFHGPKPHRISDILSGKASTEEAEAMRDLLTAHREGYEYYVGEYNRYLAQS